MQQQQNLNYPLSSLAGSAAFVERHASLHFQPVNEPASGRAGRMFLQVHRLHGKTGPDVGLHRHVQRNQFSRCEIFLDHWQRHITPPQSGTQEGVLRAHIR